MNNKYCFVLLLSIFHVFYTCGSDNNNLWQQVQKTTENAVVKIFSFSSNFHWFNPHVTPSCNSCTGSGFFINETDIITNSHVVDRARTVFIGIHSLLGKKKLKVDVISICPQHDLALLRLTSESLAIVQKELNGINYLKLGDSNTVHRSDEVLTFGFPLDSEELKSTSGIVSGRNIATFKNFSGYLIQIDAPTNPGNSGGPLLNRDGMVIGINNCQNSDAQNVNFAIPVNNLKMILSDLYTTPLLRINNLDLVWSPGNDEIRKHLGNPLTYGCYICGIDQGGNAQAAGLQIGDMLYEIDGHIIDSYGEIVLSDSKRRMMFFHYIAQLPLGASVSLFVYRNGIPLTFTICIDNKAASSCLFKYPAYENIEYEIFGGMIVMELTANYIEACIKERPALQRYLTNMYYQGPRLVVANFFDDSQLAQMKTIRWADTINEVNGERVSTLAEFRRALLKSVEKGNVVINTTDELTLNTDKVLTVLPLYDSCKETVKLSVVHNYQLSETVKELIRQVDNSLL